MSDKASRKALIDSEKLLEWLLDLYHGTGDRAEKYAYGRVEQKIESGAFLSTESEGEAKMNDIRLAQLSMFISRAKELGNPNYPPLAELFDEVMEQRSLVKKMQKVINDFPVPCKLDEDIPDDDKEAAYKMGYADAIADIVESIKDEL